MSKEPKVIIPRVVTGKQLALPDKSTLKTPAAVVAHLKAKGHKAPRRLGRPAAEKVERTPRLLGTEAKGERVRYVEPPAKVKGSPFYALRVPGHVLSAFKRKHGKEHANVIKAFMAKSAGVELSSEDE